MKEHDNQFFELKRGDVEYIPRGSLVNSGGAGPCIAVFLYNPKGKEAYAGHFASGSAVDECVEMLNLASAKFGRLDKVIAYLTGSSIHVFQEHSNKSEKDEVVSCLIEKKILPKNIHTYWNATNIASSNLELDVDTGKIKHEAYSDDDLDDIIDGGSLL